MKRTALALIAIVGLAYLAADPTPVAKAMHRVTHPGMAYDMPAMYEEALEGHEKGEVHWTMQLGLFHYFSDLKVNGVELDPDYGAELIESAMDAGYARAGVWWYWFIDKSDEGLERAARAGATMAISHRAIQTAGTYCSTGQLPPGTMEAFVEEYADAFGRWHLEDFTPEGMDSEWTEFEESADETRTQILEGIPAKFDELCSEIAAGSLTRSFPTLH